MSGLPIIADPAKCLILVPVGHHIEPACDQALQVLAHRGYPVRRVYGHAAIDQGRSQMATDALAEGFEELMWIDADVLFHPDDVDRLRSHSEPFVCGVYPKKGQRALAANVMSGTDEIVFGPAGGLVKLSHVGFGFVLTHRIVYEAVQQKCDLPLCNQMFDKPIVPYFLPLLQPTDKGPWYLGEDYAFCQRAHNCGFCIVADTTIRLWHIGSYRYGWEDAGLELDRYTNFSFRFASAQAGDNRIERNDSQSIYQSDEEPSPVAVTPTHENDATSGSPIDVGPIAKSIPVPRQDIP
ncbi:MAG: hypothetical protein O2955_06425 [Planctomycetota bacterium]|nr:hypothetical protein [Planctomycetota bacterium]MDA1212129.1 hypothetical protein [Planctomycetota bacterium]